jgi:hypothetical protein
VLLEPSSRSIRLPRRALLGDARACRRQLTNLYKDVCRRHADAGRRPDRAPVDAIAGTTIRTTVLSAARCRIARASTGSAAACR